MKKYKIFLAAVALLGLSSCIEEKIPTEYVLDSQIQPCKGWSIPFIPRWADI